MPVLDMEVMPEVLPDLVPEVLYEIVSTPPTIAYILKRAVELLTPPGKWIQGTVYRDGAMCAAGALIAAVDPNYYAHEEDCLQPMRNRYHYKSALEFVSLHVLCSQDKNKLVQFNDTPGRTQEEVVRVLRDGATLAREQGV